ncbi:MAG TPA: GPW/gp25 family protein [Kofleriaceae bacterium]|jgi:phage baseplate assembly protein W|nr:GPW/gp25 family protein [Kofleriaceae bacterium]
MREEFHSILFPIAIDRGLGKVADEESYALHVEQLIKQVLLTNPGERINRPDFGCGLRRMVFAPNSDAAASLLKVTILQALDKWLGTVIKVDDVTVVAQDETLSVSLRYLLTARQERRYLNLRVEVAL